jgi:hypothetical protein
VTSTPVSSAVNQELDLCEWVIDADPNAFADQLCNDAYEQLPHSLAASVVEPEGMTCYPLETNFKDFPLTKNFSKMFRIGADIRDFSPYIMLLGDPNSKSNRMWIRMSIDEFRVLTCDSILAHVKNAVCERKTDADLTIGGLKVGVQLNNNNKNYQPLITLQRKDSTVKLYLGGSSWDMIKRAAQLMLDKLTKIEHLTKSAKTHWADMLQSCKNYCLSVGYKTPTHVINQNVDSQRDLISDGMTVPFPESLKTK